MMPTTKSAASMNMIEDSVAGYIGAEVSSLLQ